ncbi:amidase [Flavimaricola marinus]|uniref:Biuret hydrolase n=1 Tax=Flavimaricola marinus TaxID=1819565 RepID=A0A238LGY2_9RHOB|nr:amidase [Flavimaricola marinus]SMY08150.1 Biuret hydrolase [Flavimaricola marinus]
MTARPETAALDQTEAALTRIAAVDGDIRAFVTVLGDSARAEARASDTRHAAGQSLGPLDGMPFAVKDNIAVAGVPTQSGTLAFDAPATADATVVARLRAAGAVLIGTLNMHEGALGATTDNPFWGRCMNPLRPGFTPGGSSGGSAAAVAAGMVPWTLGTDTMGSVRIPAAYCGLWGLKPTRGRVPVTGLTHLSWTLDSIGPLARDPATLGAVLAVMSGPDAADPMSAVLQGDGALPGTLDGMRFGIPDAAALADCEPVVLDAFDDFKASLIDAGAVLVPTEVAGWSPGALRRAGLLVSEVECAEALGDALDGTGLSDGFRAMLDYGKRAKPGRIARAYQQLQQLAVGFEAAIQGLDGIVLPTAPQRAFAHGDPVPAGQADFTALANVAGAPALTLPLTARDGGLPCAAQIIGPRESDQQLVAMGQLMQGLPPIWRPD